MKDTIYRQDAIDIAVQSAIYGDLWAKEKIRELPSAERKGKWERTYLDHEAMGIRPSICYCSECQQCVVYPTNYCPNCGTRMVKDEE